MRNVESGHVPKSKLHREYYTKSLKDRNYEPTVDDTLKFPESDDNDQDFSLPKSTSTRKIAFKHQFQDHWSENWIKYIITILTIILFFLMIDSKVDISRIITDIKYLNDDVKELKDSQKQNIEKQHQQDLDIQETKLNLKNIEEKIENKKSVNK